MEALFFLNELIRTLVVKGIRSEDVWDQTWLVLKNSWLIVVFSGFFVGAVMAIQFALQLQEFSALSYLGGLTTSGTIRELGPLLIAFMLAGRIGAYTTSELGTMRVTEQIDAVICLGADPLREMILPRFLGIILSSFQLLIVGIFMSIFGASLTAYFLVGMDFSLYISFIPQVVTLRSIGIGLLKVVLFSFALAWLSTYFGFATRGGAREVGAQVVRASVFTMVAIVLLDWLSSLFL
ncbi:MAG: ABC transporter permease [Bdellovibrionaceae bacterium]|jgi:phospholipid/cholesterol/gamma-HCH transport system permease protein|nr:ABC transporter permease [Pseudobdellovibrionaceae bacterium]